MDRGLDLRTQNEEHILEYLLTEDEPEWVSLQQHPSFTTKWVLFFLKRSRPIPRHSVEAIYQNKLFRKQYQVNLHLVRCKSTPAHIGVSLVHSLRWVDLYWSLRLPFLPGALRQKIEAHIIDILPRLTLGEKITLVKQAPRSLVRQLRTIEEPMAVQALLQNYHFTFDDAVFMASYLQTSATTLNELGRSKKWLNYKEVKVALLRHQNTPKSLLLPIAKTLTDQNLRFLLQNPQLPLYNRRLIQRILEERFCIMIGSEPSELDEFLQDPPFKPASEELAALAEGEVVFLDPDPLTEE